MLRHAFAFVLAMFVAAPAFAAKRVALVIGNSAYVHAPALPNPKNDAADMAQKLESLGFAVTVGIDLDLSGVKGKVREFRSAAAQAELALFFYAGHGIQAGGVNYMLPIDADIADEAALDFEAIEMDAVLKSMADVPTLVVLLDACRDNPFEEKLARSLQRGGRTRNIALGEGLAQIDAGTGTLVAFATQPGNVALDGEGRNSPFTAALLKHIGQPGMSLTDELILVRNEVLGATGNRQRPWDSSSLTGRVVLKAAEPVAPPAPVVKSPIESDFDLARSLGTKEAWEAFLERHGESGDMRVALATRERDRVTVAGGSAEPPSRELPASESADMATCSAQADPKNAPFDTLPQEPDSAVEKACRKALDEKPDDANRLFLLARVLHGSGQTKEALRLYDDAGSRGNANAINNIGALLKFGAPDVEKDEASAAAMFRKAAEAGNAIGMYNLGTMLRTGTGVPADGKEALEWLGKAAELGRAEAMTEIGHMHRFGEGGLNPDDKNALEWYRKAAALQEPFAVEYLRGLEAGPSANAAASPDAGPALQVVALPTVSESDAKECARLRGDASRPCDASGMYLLAAALESGEDSLPKDLEQSRLWFEKSAAAGEINAMTRLAVNYKYGADGYPLDFAKAAEWYAMAANTGDATSMDDLARLYESGGNGLTADERLAYSLYLDSAQKGYYPAMYRLAIAFENGRLGVTQDYVEAALWYRKAADAGSYLGALGLAQLADKGVGGLSGDGPEAARWYLAACALSPDATKEDIEDALGEWSSAMRRSLQQQLRDNGRYAGPVDGAFNDDLKAALQACGTR